MLNRRDFLTIGGGLIIGSVSLGISDLLSIANITGSPVYAGWFPDRNSTIRFKRQSEAPYFRQVARNLAGTGKNKRVLLWKYFESATGKKFIPHDQSVGDCVAQAFGLGIDFLDSIQITRGRGKWIAKNATEVIYAGGRVEIGKGKIAGDGMHGSWAARWVKEYGTLLRRPYLNGKYDFTRYSGSKSRKWAHICKRCTEWGGGVPDELEPIIKKHPVKTTTLVTNWKQARDAVCNGYPVVVCSNVGFNSKRDRQGFATQYGTWYHSILLAGIDDIGQRPGGLMINSWGANWIKGPTRLDQPLGSFWADADVIDSMLSQNDSFALSNYIGYPRRNLDYKLY